MPRKHCLLYAITSGLLLSLPWHQSFSGIFLFVAFVPLLLVQDGIIDNPGKNKGSLFLYASLSFFIWNISTTWWIANATFAGALAAILINTFLFSFVFWLYHLTRKIGGKSIGRLALISYWTAFEYVYLSAEISWPWLNIGNGFAHDICFIQWYEYTGALGGTIWVLITNILLVELVKKYTAKGSIQIINVVGILCLIVVPAFFSWIMYYTYEEKIDPYDVVAIQPNIDCYNTTISTKKQCNLIYQMIDSAGSSSVDYFITPEVSVKDNIWEDAIRNNYALPTLKRTMEKYPQANLIFGAYTYRRIEVHESESPTAQRMKSGNYYFESFNTAIQIDSTERTQLYHKSKLVVGVEKMPYPKALMFLKKIVEGFGGSFVSYSIQASRGVFESSNKKIHIAPVICYESVYGEFVTDYIKNGANIIFILTNDGWWGDTPGHQQHLSYAQLRAIETRRSIARSANTGISAFINQKGEVIKALEWNKRGAIKESLNANDYQTFYVKHGDYLGRIACVISICLVLFTAFTFVTKLKI